MALTDRDKREAISDGIYAWLTDHPISGGDAISDGCRRGVETWLGANSG